MSRKKRTKRHNYRKRYNRQTLAALKNIVLAFVYDEENTDAHLYNIRTGEYISVARPDLVKSLAEGEFKWTLLLASFYRSQMGEEYAAYEEETVPHPCWNEQVQVAALDRLTEMADEGNTLQWLTVGYIASPRPIEFDYETAEKIFTELGAYRDNLSQWEKDQQQEKEHC